MPIIKTTNSRLKSQLNSQYPVDRVPKSIICIPYFVGDNNITPSEGGISFFPNSKPQQVTSLIINSTTLLGSNLQNLYEFSTEGALMVYERANADNFVLFKINNLTKIDGGKSIKYETPQVLASDAISIFSKNSQVCITLFSSPTSEAISNIDGGYYG